MDYNAMDFDAMDFDAMVKEKSLDCNRLNQEFPVYEWQEAIEDPGMDQFGQHNPFLEDTQSMKDISPLMNTNQFTLQGHGQTIPQPDSQLRAISQSPPEIIIQTSQQSLGMNHRHIPLSAVGRSKKETRDNDRRTTAVRIAEDKLN